MSNEQIIMALQSVIDDHPLTARQHEALSWCFAKMFLEDKERMDG